MHRESRDRRSNVRRWSMYALDGAGDDGSTLYVLHDEHSRLVGAHEVPQPLEQLALQNGAYVIDVYPPLTQVERD